MPSRTLYLVRHGEADAFGQLTEAGREQCRLLGRRLAELPIDVVWHSPLPRGRDSATVLAGHLPAVLVDEVAELVDHVPHVPPSEELSPAWTRFFDGYGRAEAEAGRRIADRLTARFLVPNAGGRRSSHEVLVTHAYPVAWMVRAALRAPADSWMSLAGIANASVTIVECHDGEQPVVVQVNDQSHLPSGLRWTGFAGREES